MEAVPLKDFVENLSKILPIIMRAFMRQYIKELSQLKVTVPQFFVLEYLYQKGESKMGDIAHFWGVSMPAITNIIDRLVRQGYLFRLFEPEDRRVIKVRLKPKGKSLINKINLKKKRLFLKIFGRISEVDRQHYLRILNQIKDIVSQNIELTR